MACHHGPFSFKHTYRVYRFCGKLKEKIVRCAGPNDWCSSSTPHTVRLGAIYCAIWGQIQRDPQSINSQFYGWKEPCSDRTSPSTLEITSCIVARGLIFLPQNFAQLVLDSTVVLRHALNENSFAQAFGGDSSTCECRGYAPRTPPLLVTRFGGRQFPKFIFPPRLIPMCPSYG